MCFQNGQLFCSLWLLDSWFNGRENISIRWYDKSIFSLFLNISYVFGHLQDTDTEPNPPFLAENQAESMNFKWNISTFKRCRRKAMAYDESTSIITSVHIHTFIHLSTYNAFHIDKYLNMHYSSSNFHTFTQFIAKNLTRALSPPPRVSYLWTCAQATFWLIFERMNPWII